MSQEFVSRSIQTWVWIATLALGTAACDFFQELESEPGGSGTDTGAATDTSASTGNTDGDGPCELALDDHCIDQDTVQSCSIESGTVQELDCLALCGTFTNFSCVASASGQHACWCVESGANKVLSCTELEGCLAGCELDETLSCADRCFGRTDALTIRLFGALVHCAETTCEDLCFEAPGACAACLDSARLEGGGGCSLPRAVCDDDRNPDEPWP